MMDIDDKNKFGGEDEYRPSEFDSANVFEVSSSETKTTGSTTSLGGGNNNAAGNILEHLKRKNIIIAVVVVIVLFCIYKIADVLLAPGASRHKTAPKTPAIQAQMPTAIPQPHDATKNAAEQLPIAAAAVTNRLNTLEQQNTAEQANIQQLTNEVNNLQSAIANIDSKISNLSDSVQSVANQVAKQQAAAQQVAHKKAVQRAKEAPRPVYYVKAMVAGRAWLATNEGATITVSLGNNLPGYGTVDVIDPNQGLLVTSSGAIIGYSPGDS